MEWTRSETLALASHTCTLCHGLGMRTCRQGASSPCSCVYRSVFRACLDRFRLSANKEKSRTKVTLDRAGASGERRYSWGRKDEEYLADFVLVSRRTLTEEEYRLFKFHVLLGADWKLCCRQLKMERGRFFHAVYRIQEKLGKVFSELQPFALYPVDEYFGSNRTYTAMVTPTPQPPASHSGVSMFGRRDNVVAFPPRPVSASFPIRKAA